MRVYQFRHLGILLFIDRDTDGAKNGTRTRDPNLGKVVLYQLSYFRISSFQSLFGTLSDGRAKNGTRTRDPNLGKVVLYQLSYFRDCECKDKPSFRLMQVLREILSNIFFIKTDYCLINNRLLLARIFTDERIKFAAPLGLLEFAGAIVGNGDGSLLLDAPHLHAEVTGFDHDDDPFGLEGLGQTVADLRRETLLHLKAAGIDLDQAGYLAEPYDALGGDIAYVYLSEEGEQMVLAEGVKLDVAHDDDARTRMLENGRGYDVVCRLTIASGQFHHGFGGPLGCLEQSFAIGVVAQ